MNDTETHRLADVANPFDFANPVSTKELFIGREDERKDIIYYLRHARNAKRSINLALLGERAAGKTSLLNVIEIEAEELGLVPVRVDLNESDVETPLAFWFKMFDAIVHRTIVESNHDDSGPVFGGTNGATFDTYLNLISTYEVPGDKTFCPFLFPIQYAKASGADNPTARVSDIILKRDLARIAEEVGRPIVLLIDECNILSSHRALLEMVRNTFMNLPGYMLVFTGTPDLFPVMDEVFSPIIRQFKRIEVKPFADICETRTAIFNPLDSIDQQGLFDMPDEAMLKSASPSMLKHLGGDLKDLHDLTGGRPYEIQLVCHFMFKRVQRGKESIMRLSFDVIEDVLAELRQSHDEDTRPVVSAVKGLNDSELRVLRLLLRSGGKVPVKQILFCGIITKQVEAIPEGVLAIYESFKEQGILTELRGCANFSGDDFDRIVCKYAARQRGIHLTFEPSQMGDFIEQSILFAASHRYDSEPSRRTLIPVFSSHRHIEEQQVQLLDELWCKMDATWKITDLFHKMPAIIVEVYSAIVRRQDHIHAGMTLLRVDVEVEGVGFTGFYADIGVHDCTLPGRTTETVAEMQQLAGMHGGTIRYETKQFTGVTSDDVHEFAVATGDAAVLEVVARTHSTRAFQEYVDNKNKTKAAEHASRAAVCLDALDDDDVNNVGYILLSSGKYELARQVLRNAVTRAPEHSLAHYNLGLVSVHDGDYKTARKLFETTVRLMDKQPIIEVGVLLLPKWADGHLVLDEKWGKMGGDTGKDNLSLAEFVRTALSVIESN